MSCAIMKVPWHVLRYALQLIGVEAYRTDDMGVVYVTSDVNRSQQEARACNLRQLYSLSY